MPKKHHAIYSDPTGAAAAAASPVKRRVQRAKHAGAQADGTVSTVSGTVVQEMVVDREAVARLAYSYWEARGFIGGSPDEDWLRAEREIRETLAASASA